MLRAPDDRRYPWPGVGLIMAVMFVLALAGGPGASAHGRGAGRSVAALRGGITAGQWLTSWSAPMQTPTSADPVSVAGFRATTLREAVFTTSGGSAVRVHLSNAFGRRPLAIAGASIGGVPLRFGGHTSVVIRRGESVVSDPATLTVTPLQRLTVTLRLRRSTGPATGDDEGRVLTAVGGRRRVTGWWFLDGVDTRGGTQTGGAVVALGDSITAGIGSTTDAFDAWPDDLARRLVAAGEPLSVIDAGLGGNRILNGSACCGPSAIGRFGADVLDQAGVRDVILLEGINDISYSGQRNPLTAPHTDVTAAQLIAGDERIIAAAHAAGLRIFGATLPPFGGARYWTAAGEAKREALNDWIETSGAFDGVIDFASALADPGDPTRLAPQYDSGDHLHPNDRGYAAMADAIDLQELLPPA